MPIQSTYDPTSANPYQAPELPQQQPMPGTEPMPAKPSPFGGQPGYQFNGGPISSGGAIAGIADNVLRGIVNGHAQAEQWKALKLKKKSDDLNASYQADTQRLNEIAYRQYRSTGRVDTSSPEYQQAVSASNGSWSALQDFRGQLLEQQGGGKKKGKGKPQRSPQEVAADPNADPLEVAQTAYMVAQKIGDPAVLRVQSYNTPQAYRYWQQQQQQSQYQDLHAQNELSHEQALATYNKYAGMSKEQIEKLPPEQQTAFENSKQVLWPPEAQKVPVAGLMRYRKDAKGNTLEYKVDAEGNEIPDTERPLSATGSQGPKVGSFGDFMLAAYGPHPTPQQYIDGWKLSKAAMAGTTSGEHVAMVPQKDGTILPITIETTSTKSFGTPPAVPTGRQDSAPTELPAAPNSPATPTPSATPSAPTRRQRTTATPAAPATRAHHNGAGVVSVGAPVGGRATPTQSKADEDVVAAVKLDSLANQAIQAREPGQQRQLALGLIKGMAGRVNMQEYAIYTKSYGFANTVDGLIEGIKSGKMPQAVVLQLARDAHANLKAAKEAQKEAYANQNTPATVKMKSPTGQVQPVPADQVEHYKSLGAVVVN